MLIGKALTRDEDIRLVRGRGNYVDDIDLPGGAYAAFVHSPHAHANVRAIDTRVAGEMPGVLAVLTDADWQAAGLGVLPVIHPVNFHDGRPMNEAPRPVFARDHVCYVGDNVACVIAETRFQAMDAAEAVDVDYEPLPAIVDTGRALDDSAALVHSQFGTNEAQEWRLGDKESAERAIATAHHVTELTLVSNRVAGAAIENRSYAGDYDPVTDRYTLYAAGQMPHWYRQWIARDALFIPEHKVRVVVPDVGGGFGPKAFFYMEMPVILWAAKRLGRPVRWVAQRTESFATDTHGRDHVTHAKMAFDPEGRVLALHVETTACLGGYHNPFAAGIACMFYPGTLTGLYKTPTAYASVRGVYTNTAPVDAYRGSGRPEATYVNERLFENGARELGIDPLEMRRRSYLQSTEYPYRTPLGRTWDSGNPPGLHEKLMHLTDYDGLRRQQAELQKRGERMGVGAAAFVESSGAGPSRRNAAMNHWSGGFETALIRVHSDAKVTVLTGSHSQGQGHDITFRQIAADTLGLGLDDIDYVEGDTDRIPAGCGTWASRSLSTGGMAIVEAGQRVIRKATELAAHLLECAAEDIEYDAGTFAVRGTDRTISFREIAAMAYAGYDYPDGFELGLEETVFFDPIDVNFPSGMHLATVMVDDETGRVTLTGYYTVDDCGRIINPMIVEGQVHGGLGQGIGQAMVEQVVYDEASGQLITGSFMDYGMPRAPELPSFATDFQETLNPNNALGVKGGSETGTIGPPAAIGNAIVDALWDLGVHHVAMPYTPSNVRRAIEAALTANS